MSLSSHEDDEVMDGMKTAFSESLARFPNVSEKIKTEDFLKLSSLAVGIINRFGKVFSPVTYDMNGNINKLSLAFEEDKENHAYLECMILRKHTQGETVATDALLWLRRALHFLSSFYQSVIDDSSSEICNNDLAPFLKKAYTETLEPHHGWLGTQLFNVLSRFAPTREQLIYTLALENHLPEAYILEEMHKYNTNLISLVRILNIMYNKFGLEPPVV